MICCAYDPGLQLTCQGHKWMDGQPDGWRNANTMSPKKLGDIINQKCEMCPYDTEAPTCPPLSENV